MPAIDTPAVADAGVAVEHVVPFGHFVFAYAERSPDSPLGRGVHAAGHEIQRVLSTVEPTEDQLEVGSAALQEILRAESGDTSLSSAA